MGPSLSAQPVPDHERTGPLRQLQDRPTEAQVATMVAQYAEGATANQLAVEFRCARQTVALRLKAYGIQLRNRPAPDEDVTLFIELYESGLSLVKVTEETGFSSKTVLNYLRAEGVQLRDTHGRPTSIDR